MNIHSRFASLGGGSGASGGAGRVTPVGGHRIITGYYPRLSLATGQRFASKAGHLARFQDLQGTRLVAEYSLNTGTNPPQRLKP